MAMCMHIPSTTINHKTFLKPLTPTTKPHFSSPHKTHFSKQNIAQFNHVPQSGTLKRKVFENLNDKEFDPVQILEKDGDWSSGLFWAVVGFLNQTSRSKCVIKVFDRWISKDGSRVSDFNYERIIRLLVEEGLVEYAVMALKDMKDIHRILASPVIYDLIIRGFIEKGRFEDALFHLNEMEIIGIKPHTSTYNELIKAYAQNGLYDDMAKCVKRMESNGCFPDHATYNLLIREFSRAGLIKRMERTCRFVMSKKIDFEASTMVAMLEAYANFGDLEKMEKVYRKVLRLKPKVYLDDVLIQKVATVYIENFMFSRLHDMGINLYSRTGNNIAWCLQMLAHACLLSRTGMESVVREMDYKKMKWTVTIANIMLFAYAKIEDFGHFKAVLLEMEARNVKPDIVTCGVLYDTHRFDGIDSWRKMGFFENVVEFRTDPLVLVAFGKGDFLKTVEELDDRKRKVLTYEHLIELVKQHKHKNR